MKILFLVAKSFLSGHVLSTLTIARAMKKRGHDILFAAPRGKMTPIIEKELLFLEVNIPNYHGTRQTYFTWKSFPAIARLQEIVKREQIEFIHAFDERSYIHAYIVSLLTGTPLTCTLCGGIAPFYNIPVGRKIMTFSEEQKHKLVSVFEWEPQRIDVVRTRIDVEQILSNPISDLREIAPDINIQPTIPIIIMISTIDESKIISITSLLETAKLLLRQEEQINLVLIGWGPLLEQVRTKAEAINQESGEKHIWLTGPVLDAFRFLSQADVVLGVGRSIFEGMVYGKPTIVLGETGYAGVVSGENLDEIAYYNFSGRNQKVPSPPEVLAQELDKLLSDDTLRTKIGAFGKEFVMQEINVNQGLARIEEVYRVNMEKKSVSFTISQWLSLFKIMIPIWRDNVYHTLSMPIKRALGLVKED